MPGLEIGTVAGWVTAFSSLGIFGALSTIIIAWWRRGVSLKGLENKDEADLRDHWADELKRLTERVTVAEDRQRECEEREASLRTRLTQAEDDIIGLKRQIADNSAGRMMILENRRPSDTAPHAAASAPRVRAITAASAQLHHAFPPIQDEEGK